MSNITTSIKTNIKMTLRRSIASTYYYSGLYKIYQKGKVHILMYHRVLKANDETMPLMQPGMYVTDVSFDKQMKFLTNNYTIISLSRLLELWESGEFDTTERYCIITFDDGWVDNYVNAFPILKKHKIPATIFLTTSLIGTNHWFWPERISYLLLNYYEELFSLDKQLEFSNDEVILTILSAIKDKHDCTIEDTIDFVIEKLKKFSDLVIDNTLNELYKLFDLTTSHERMLLNWDEIEEMSNSGITFGSHTCNHKILTNIELNEAKNEIQDSLHLLTSKKINYIPIFCYPNGNFNLQIKQTVRDCGYKAAVSTIYGFENQEPSDYYSLCRIGVHNDISSTIPLFSFHLSGIRQNFDYWRLK